MRAGIANDYVRVNLMSKRQKLTELDRNALQSTGGARPSLSAILIIDEVWRLETVVPSHHSYLSPGFGIAVQVTPALRPLRTIRCVCLDDGH